MATLIFTGSGIAKNHMPFTAFGATTLNSDIFDSHNYPVEFAMAVGRNNTKCKIMLQGSDDQINWTELNATNLVELNTSSTKHTVSRSPTSDSGTSPNSFAINGYRYLIWQKESAADYLDYGYSNLSQMFNDVANYCKANTIQYLSYSELSNCTAYMHRYYRFVYTGQAASSWAAADICISPIAEALRNVKVAQTGRMIYDDNISTVLTPNVRIGICNTAEGTYNKAASMDEVFPTTTSAMNHLDGARIYVKFANPIGTTATTNARLRVKGLVDGDSNAVYRYILRQDGTRITKDDAEFPPAGMYLMEYVKDGSSYFWKIVERTDV